MSKPARRVDVERLLVALELEAVSNNEANVPLLQDAILVVADLKAENHKLREAVLWVLGERDSIGEEPPPIAGRWRRRFWWRTELRRRARL